MKQALENILSADRFTVLRIEIVDLYATKRASFEPGVITCFVGGNGEGKTGLLQAMRDFFSGGSHPSSIRIGAKKGHILWELKSNLGGVLSIKKTQRQNGISIEMLDGDGQDVTESPQTVIRMMADSEAVDPAKIVTKSAEELVPILLKIMPIAFSKEEVLTAISGFVGSDYNDIEDHMNLDGLQAFSKRVYEDRTRVNTLAKDADGHVHSLQKAIPGGSEDIDWKFEHERLSQECGSLQKTLADTLKEIDQAERIELSAIDRILAENIEALRLQATADRNAVQSKANEFRTEERSIQQPGIDSKLAEEAVAKERAESAIRMESLKQQLEVARKKHSDYSTKSEYLTLVLETLKDLERRKMESLPIPGMAVQSTGVLYQGVPFHQVNTAKRVELSFMICALKQGKLRLMICDDTEHMDTATWIAFQEGAKTSGFQIQMAKVLPEGGPLSIEMMQINGTWSRAKEVQMEPAIPTANSQQTLGPKLIEQSEMRYPD